MKSLAHFENIFIYHQKIDFRKSIDGLGSIVQIHMKENLFGPSLFVFFNKDKNKVKCLYWDKTGFALWMKRLEKQKFPLPKRFQSTIILNSQHLEWLLEGIDVFKIKPHYELNYDKIT